MRRLRICSAALRPPRRRKLRRRGRTWPRARGGRVGPVDRSPPLPRHRGGGAARHSRRDRPQEPGSRRGARRTRGCPGRDARPGDARRALRRIARRNRRGQRCELRGSPRRVGVPRGRVCRPFLAQRDRRPSVRRARPPGPERSGGVCRRPAIRASGCAAADLVLRGAARRGRCRALRKRADHEWCRHRFHDARRRPARRNHRVSRPPGKADRRWRRLVRHRTRCLHRFGRGRRFMGAVPGSARLRRRPISSRRSHLGRYRAAGSLQPGDVRRGAERRCGVSSLLSDPKSLDGALRIPDEWTGTDFEPQYAMYPKDTLHR